MRHHENASVPSGRRRPARLAGVLGATAVLSLAGIGPSLARAADDAADLARGEALYENHCGDCHDRSVHRRESRLVESSDALRIWVRAWSVHQRLGWGEEEIDDVSAWLEATLYRFGG